MRPLSWCVSGDFLHFYQDTDAASFQIESRSGEIYGLQIQVSFTILAHIAAVGTLSKWINPPIFYLNSFSKHIQTCFCFIWMPKQPSVDLNTHQYFLKYRSCIAHRHLLPFKILISKYIGKLFFLNLLPAFTSTAISMSKNTFAFRATSKIMSLNSAVSSVSKCSLPTFQEQLKM